MKLINRMFAPKLMLIILSVLLIIVIYNWIHYLVQNNYISERFSQRDTGNPETSHTVNLPLTTSYSCDNFCGPQSRCAITGHQCTSDIDCPGCQPYVPPLSDTATMSIPGDNAAGKITTGVTPSYSILTTDIGTKASEININGSDKPPRPNFGKNTWKKAFDQDQQMFNDKYKPPALANTPYYKERPTMTSTYVTDDPYAANDVTLK